MRMSKQTKLKIFIECGLQVVGVMLGLLTLFVLVGVSIGLLFGGIGFGIDMVTKLGEVIWNIY